MIKSEYSKSYNRDQTRVRRKSRRHLHKLSILLLVMGVLCVVISMVFFARSFTGYAAARAGLRHISAIYVLSGLAMLVVRVGVVFALKRAEERKKRHSLNRGLAPQENKPVPNGNGVAVAAPDKQSGMVLILLLVVLGLMTGLVLQVQLTARSLLRREQAERRTIRLQQAATDVAREALQRLADDEDLFVDYEGEPWSGTREVKTPDGIATRVKVVDADRAFNLNNVGVTGSSSLRSVDDILMDLLTLCGDFEPAGRVDALRHFVDKDGEGVAESPLYLGKNPPYEAPNRNLYSFGELLWVDGFSKALFARHERRSVQEFFNADLIDCVSVFPVSLSRPAPVNVNTAKAEVLMGILGLGQETLVRTIVAMRMEKPIRSLDAIGMVLDPLLLEAVRPYLDVSSRYFTVEAQAFAEGQTQRVQLLAHRDPSGGVQVMNWIL